jgi:hypothetical protein
MMGWGLWPGPMWLWWILSVAGFGICVLLAMAMIRALGGGRFMCSGRHAPESDETSELRREVRELREELNRLKIAR